VILAYGLCPPERGSGSDDRRIRFAEKRNAPDGPAVMSEEANVWLRDCAWAIVIEIKNVLLGTSEFDWSTGLGCVAASKHST
jgi:hypothetical protein